METRTNRRGKKAIQRKIYVGRRKLQMKQNLINTLRDKRKILPLWNINKMLLKHKRTIQRTKGTLRNTIAEIKISTIGLECEVEEISQKAEQKDIKKKKWEKRWEN